VAVVESDHCRIEAMDGVAYQSSFDRGRVHDEGDAKRSRLAGIIRAEVDHARLCPGFSNKRGAWIISIVFVIVGERSEHTSSSQRTTL